MVACLDPVLAAWIPYIICETPLQYTSAIFLWLFIAWSGLRIFFPYLISLLVVLRRSLRAQFGDPLY
jgi:hypothetical protein